MGSPVPAGSTGSSSAAAPLRDLVATFDRAWTDRFLYIQGHASGRQPAQVARRRSFRLPWLDHRAGGRPLGPTGSSCHRQPDARRLPHRTLSGGLRRRPSRRASLAGARGFGPAEPTSSGGRSPQEGEGRSALVVRPGGTRTQGSTVQRWRLHQRVASPLVGRRGPRRGVRHDRPQGPAARPLRLTRLLLLAGWLTGTRHVQWRLTPSTAERVSDSDDPGASDRG
jgi:hypothetical protein